MKRIIPIIILSICTIAWIDANPITYAIHNNDSDIKQIIENNKQLINEKINISGIAPLHFGSANGHTEAVRLLLEQPNINPNIQDHSGNTPLHLASKNNYIEIINLLLEQPNINPNMQNTYDEEIPLHIAAVKNHTEAVQSLLSHYVQRNVQNEDQKTPLDLAIGKHCVKSCNKYLSTITLLIAYNASISKYSLQKYLNAYPEIDQACYGKIPKTLYYLSTSQILQIMASRGYDNQITNYILYTPVPDSTTLLANIIMLNKFELADKLLPFIPNKQRVQAFNKVVKLGNRLQTQKLFNISSQNITKNTPMLSKQAQSIYKELSDQQQQQGK